jgi:TIR domain
MRRWRRREHESPERASDRAREWGLIAWRGMYTSHVFVSYRAHDSEAAESLTRGLQARGLTVWWDKDPGGPGQRLRLASDVRGAPIRGGDETIEEELAVAIAGSLLVSAITSPRTLESLWVRKEIELARNLEKPLFFCHLVDPASAKTVSVGRGEADPGSAPAGADALIESFARGSETKVVPSRESVAFTHELSRQEGLNLVGHVAVPLAEIASVCADLETLAELAELVVHRGEAITAETLRRFWPEYDALCARARSLQEELQERFGRQVGVGRQPAGHGFRLKRPFVATRVRHLERLLADEAFREAEFHKLDGQ